MNILNFSVNMKAEPQGSSKAFVIPGTNRAIVTSANPKMKPFRSEVTRMAMATLSDMNCDEPMLGKHVPATIKVVFHFTKPDSISKGRMHPVVKPDIDKLLRAVLDALTGVAFKDDAQVVQTHTEKRYSHRDFVEITVSEVA
jgi:Holliday junction resolvase RusA-like endonuclease